MESLGVDIKLLIAQIINFILFFLIFKKFIAKPFSQFLIHERKKEEEKEKVLAELKQKEENFIKEKDRELKKIKEEQQKNVKQLKEEIKKLREKMIAEAKKEAQMIIEKSKKQATRYEEKINRQIEQRVKELSFKIITDVLSNVMTPQLQKEVNRQMVKSLDQLRSGIRNSVN